MVPVYLKKNKDERQVIHLFRKTIIKKENQAQAREPLFEGLPTRLGFAFRVFF